MTESRISASGRTTLPAVIRRHLRLRAGDKLRYVIDGAMVQIIPIRKSLKLLKGRLPKPARRLSIAEMNEAIVSKMMEEDTGKWADFVGNGKK